MYDWYENATVCLVYLADISVKAATRNRNAKKLKESRWFTRGWTLQELLAPLAISFFDQDWIEIGTKFSLMEHLSEAARINSYNLLHPHDASVAAKMSGAARRSTTRIEDVAYCLLGLFRVNIPLLYGEGPNAFKRLQHEIINTSHDESIFAWFIKDPAKPISQLPHEAVLTMHPRQFLKSANVATINGKTTYRDLSSYNLTNLGLEITIGSRKHNGKDSECKDHSCEKWEIPLACTDDSEPERPVRLLLHRNRDNCQAWRQCPLDDDLDYFHGDLGKGPPFDYNGFRIATDLSFDERGTRSFFERSTALLFGSAAQTMTVVFTRSARKTFPLLAYPPKLETWIGTPNSTTIKTDSLAFADKTGPAFIIMTVDVELDLGTSLRRKTINIVKRKSLHDIVRNPSIDIGQNAVQEIKRSSDFCSIKIEGNRYLNIAAFPIVTPVKDRSLSLIQLKIGVSDFDVRQIL
ncbi:MAG: hypothetical protein Q9219_006472 [cf. Caloplaca sp. 3 TL-2023]